MSRIRAVWRLLLVLVHVLRGLAIVVLFFPRLSQLQRDIRVQAWAVELLERFAIKLIVNGQPPVTGPVLLVSNHISWLDIVVMHAARHCRFVSKSDIQRWPLIGTLASAAGTLYLRRSSGRDAMRVVRDMADALISGDVLAVFPEGTTGDGMALLPFHANLIQAAITARAPVQPLLLQYIDAATGRPSHAPSYVGDETLVGSIWRTLSAPGLVATVSFGTRQQADGRSRRAWAADLRAAIAGLTRDLRESGRARSGPAPHEGDCHALS